MSTGRPFLQLTATKRSLRETIMRRDVDADKRLPQEKLFFQESFDTPLSEADDLLELVRWAPRR